MLAGQQKVFFVSQAVMMLPSLLNTSALQQNMRASLAVTASSLQPKEISFVL